jgi:hypothetical protein
MSAHLPQARIMEIVKAECQRTDLTTAKQRAIEYGITIKQLSKILSENHEQIDKFAGIIAESVKADLKRAGKKAVQVLIKGLKGKNKIECADKLLSYGIGRATPENQTILQIPQMVITGKNKQISETPNMEASQDCINNLQDFPVSSSPASSLPQIEAKKTVDSMRETSAGKPSGQDIGELANNDGLKSDNMEKRQIDGNGMERNGILTLSDSRDTGAEGDIIEGNKPDKVTAPVMQEGNGIDCISPVSANLEEIEKDFTAMRCSNKDKRKEDTFLNTCSSIIEAHKNTSRSATRKPASDPAPYPADPKTNPQGGASHIYTQLTGGETGLEN